MLLTLTSAINTVREIRNTTRAKAGLAPPQPIDASAPFSVRVLRVEGSGGPLYEWSAVTLADPANITVPINGTADVKFTTKYRRTLEGFSAYALTGSFELRNTKPEPLDIEVGFGGGVREGQGRGRGG